MPRPVYLVQCGGPGEEDGGVIIFLFFTLSRDPIIAPPVYRNPELTEYMHLCSETVPV